ncbi:hypothetical protein KSP39_PZI023447 [Platanthera zijinensis]|uniref:Uncharacterized protein n=1 Tax=Platanthera zijinensis TaxID=2320716 RepID=A0AAP0ASM3_9ASPA
MGVSLAARKHPVLTTLRETKAQVMPVGEVALSIPSGTQREVVMISSTSVYLLVEERDNSHYRWQASRAVSTVGTASKFTNRGCSVRAIKVEQLASSQI